MASTTARSSVVRGRHVPAVSGISGSSNIHSASDVLAKRRPSRRYCSRGILVQGIVISLESLQLRRNHNRLKSLTSFRPDFQNEVDLLIDAGHIAEFEPVSFAGYIGHILQNN